MNDYTKAVHSNSARGRVARLISPHITAKDDLDRLNCIFSKTSYSMPDIEFLLELKTQHIERSSKVA